MIALEDTNRKLQEKLKENEEDSVDEPDPIIVPRASYLDAVAKTWVDRTAYLEALQEGRVGVLPGELNLPQKPIPKATQEEKETRIKRSESLIDSIWNFMKEDGSDVSTRSSNYSNRLIRQADKLIEVRKDRICRENMLTHMSVHVANFLIHFNLKQVMKIRILLYWHPFPFKYKSPDLKSQESGGSVSQYDIICF